MKSDGSILRTRFCDYMTLRGWSPKTQAAYLQAMIGLVRYYTAEIQAYLVYLIRDRQLAWSSCNLAFSALRCFYRDILSWDETRFHLPLRPRQIKRPEVLSIQEVERLLAAAGSLRDRTLLMSVYGAGLGVSEVVRLKAIHLEADRMLIRGCSPADLPASPCRSPRLSGCITGLVLLPVFVVDAVSTA